MNARDAMPPTGWYAFPTPLGICGIAWRGSIITATSLPDMHPGGLARRLAGRLKAPPSTPPPSVRRAIEAITDFLGGASVDRNPPVSLR